MVSSHPGLCRIALNFPGPTGRRQSAGQGRRQQRVSASLPLFVPHSDHSFHSASLAAATPPALLASLPASDASVRRFSHRVEGAPSLEISPQSPADESPIDSQPHPLSASLDTPAAESDPTFDPFTHYTSLSASDSPLQALPLLAESNPTFDPFTQYTSSSASDSFLQALPLLADASVASNPNRYVLPPGDAPVLDAAKVLTPAKAARLAADISALERDTGWRIRILTRFAPGTFDVDEVRAYWKPDERTVVVILDLTSPNILNLKPGTSVLSKLPRQFFIELQSRFGNQFYVAQEGEQTALMETAGVLVTCLSSPEGCVRVPGLSDDLFFLTLGTSAVGGTVFGFALRQETNEQVPETWQWVLIFSPLWFILFIALGIQPIASRTSDIEPLAKDTLAFLGAAAAIYLTPIFGESPAARWFRKKEQKDLD